MNQIICDKCKTHPAVPVRFPIGWGFDGTETATEYRNLDLCQKCSASLLVSFAAGSSFEFTRMVLAEWEATR